MGDVCIVKLDIIKEKYTSFFLVYAGILISLSNFKEQLINITIKNNFFETDGSIYLFSIIISTVISLYFLALDIIISGTNLSKYKISIMFLIISYCIFILIIFSPIILILLYILEKIPFNLLNSITQWLVIIFTLALSYNVALKKYKKEIKEYDFKVNKIKIDVLSNLIKTKRYCYFLEKSLSIIESKLKMLIDDKEIIYTGNDFMKIVEVAKKQLIIDKNDYEEIIKIFNIRNNVIDNKADMDDEEAISVLNKVKEILEKLIKYE